MLSNLPRIATRYSRLLRKRKVNTIMLHYAMHMACSIAGGPTSPEEGRECGNVSWFKIIIIIRALFVTTLEVTNILISVKYVNNVVWQMLQMKIHSWFPLNLILATYSYRSRPFTWWCIAYSSRFEFTSMK